MFSITPQDDIRTAQYKNMICSKNLIKKLLAAYKEGNISVRTDSKDFDSWYNKRTAADGKSISTAEPERFITSSAAWQRLSRELLLT